MQIDYQLVLCDDDESLLLYQGHSVLPVAIYDYVVFYIYFFYHSFHNPFLFDTHGVV